MFLEEGEGEGLEFGEEVGANAFEDAGSAEVDVVGVEVAADATDKEGGGEEGGVADELPGGEVGFAIGEEGAEDLLEHDGDAESAADAEEETPEESPAEGGADGFEVFDVREEAAHGVGAGGKRNR